MTSATLRKEQTITTLALPHVMPDMGPMTMAPQAERCAALKAYSEKYGWQFTPLNGKKAFKAAWQKNPATWTSLRHTPETSA